MKNNPPSRKKPGLALLGGIGIEEFLEVYWQKKPLLVRQAIPGFNGILSPQELAGLACEDEVQSRLILHHQGVWSLEQGPIDESRFSILPEHDWTLLVQGVNQHLPEAVDLMQRFNFIPYARLDDLMVSYAPDGGGVGPHFDSYDVFLLQGEGERLWRVSQQADLSLVKDAPLRILQHFDMENEWLLKPGDMLYLPPHVAHWGIAVGACMTYSIGFRAPAAQELAHEFLHYLQEHCELPGLYQDPDLKFQSHPAEISQDMVDKVSHTLSQITWQKSQVAAFLGRYLSEPKPHVVYTPVSRISLVTFEQRLKKRGLKLALFSQMLFYQNSFYLNGEAFLCDPSALSLLQQLADTRSLPAGLSDIAPALLQQMHSWYLNGYLEFN